MAGLPEVFRKTGEPSLISYDFVDYFAGLGYISFYAFYDGTNKKLNNNRIASSTPRITFNTDGAAYVLVSNIDWDLDFNIPQILGKGSIYVSTSMDAIPTTTTEMQARVDAFVYSVDAALTPTLLAQASGAVVEWGQNKAGSNRTLTKIDIPSNTKLKAGEKLRVNTQIFTKKTSAIGDAYITHLWTDGEARGTTIYNQIDPATTTLDLGYKNATDLIVTVPFKLDI